MMFLAGALVLLTLTPKYAFLAETTRILPMHLMFRTPKNPSITSAASQLSSDSRDIGNPLETF